MTTNLLEGERTGDVAQMAVTTLSERFGRHVVGMPVEVDGRPGRLSWISSKA
jgi:hypothetical protein